MKRVLLCVASTLVVLLVAAGGASASHSEGAGPNMDLVVGTGQIDAVLPDGSVIDVFIHVDAMSGPSGEDPQGHVVFHAFPPAVPFPIDIQGSVICVRASGNRATVGFVITKVKEGPLPVGFGGIFSFTDNGEPGDMDMFEGSPAPAQVAAQCLFPPATRTATSGNFVVHDATP
jgi:hypothetical protein